jgi:hypothetical protein
MSVTVKVKTLNVKSVVQVEDLGHNWTLVRNVDNFQEDSDLSLLVIIGYHM